MLLASPPYLLAATVDHELSVILSPADQRLEVTDKIRWPTGPGPNNLRLTFELHAGLKPRVLEAYAVLQLERRLDGLVPVERYSLKLPPGHRSVTLVYGGRIHDPLSAASEGRGRMQQYTSGYIAANGVYLNGNSYWYPRFDDRMVSFSMTVELPEGWEAVSQGARHRHSVGGGQSLTAWKERQPQDDIYLLANRFHVYRQATPVAEALVYLRQPDPELARRYLDATEHYLSLYSRLLGPYPYAKFALVENFWETGYGMPSFTLLGPRVIRLPFILHSSYPHEVLHNWWGNGVYVDYPTGNWSEGLTAYLADHLIQEQRQRGADYRRSALQKYADFVAEDQDFPLIAFRGRHGEVSQAVGYNKTLLFFHMLRRRLGDSTFIDGLRRFYAEHRFRAAGYADLRAAFEAVSGERLEAEFRQWTARVGAPSLRLDDVATIDKDGNYRLRGTLEQVQAQAPYHLKVPLVVQLAGTQSAYETIIEMHGARQVFDLALPGRPRRLLVDPRFDIFRRLAPGEIPVSLGQLFGAENLLFVLPASAPEFMKQAYRQLASSWGASKQDMIRDDQLRELPSDRPIWLLGWENRFRQMMAEGLRQQGVSLSPDSAVITEQVLERDSNSVVLTVTHPENAGLGLGWLGAHEPAAVGGLTRKLPHYSKYSYLAFTGEAPRNVLKGQWTVLNSPLNLRLTDEEIPPIQLTPRPPLTAVVEAGKG